MNLRYFPFEHTTCNMQIASCKCSIHPKSNGFYAELYPPLSGDEQMDLLATT